MNSGINVLKKRKFKSFIDYIKPEIKVISFFIISLMVFFIPGIFSFVYDKNNQIIISEFANFKSYSLLIFLGQIFIFSLIGRVSIKYYFKSFKTIIIFFPIMYFFNYLILMSDSNTTSQNLTSTFILTFDINVRIYILFFISSILILSCTEIEIAKAIEFLLKPLSYIKIPIREISLIISLGIRYIPILIFDSKVILEAQATRGNDYRTGGLIIRLKSFLNLLNPLILSSFYKAEETSNAMYVRGYRLNQERKFYRKPEGLNVVDVFSMIYFLNIFLFFIFIKIF